MNITFEFEPISYNPLRGNYCKWYGKHTDGWIWCRGTSVDFHSLTTKIYHKNSLDKSECIRVESLMDLINGLKKSVTLSDIVNSDDNCEYIQYDKFYEDIKSNKECFLIDKFDLLFIDNAKEVSDELNYVYNTCVKNNVVFEWI